MLIARNFAVDCTRYEMRTGSSCTQQQSAIVVFAIFLLLSCPRVFHDTLSLHTSGGGGTGGVGMPG